MKKLLSLVLILMLLGSVALANKYDDWVKEQYDFENATDAQLETYIKLGQAMIDNAQAEVYKRNGTTAQTESQIDTSTHSMDGIEYSIVKLERGEDDGQNIVIMYVDWKNTGDEPTSILATSFYVEAYQSGKEVDSVYLRNNGIGDNYMPGYGGIVFYGFENNDDSEMTFFIKDLYSLLDDSNEWSFTIDPKSL